MFKKIKELAGDTLIYGVSGIITRFISIFLIPIYTRIFAPADYGIINLINTTFLLIGIFVILGLDNAAARWYWDVEEEDERKSTFSSWFWTQLFLSVAILVIVTASSSFFSTLILKDDKYSFLFILAALNLPFTTFTLVFISWMRVRRKALGSVSFSLFNSLLTIGLSIYLVVYQKMGLKGVFLSQLLSNGISALVVLIVLRKNISLWHFRFNRIKQMLAYSIPLLPATISLWLLNSAGGYFINHYSSKTEVGLYQIGGSIAAVCSMIFWAFLQAWPPFAMSMYKQKDASRIFAMVFDIYCALGSFLVLFIFLFAPEILIILTTRDYLNAALVAGILSANIFISNLAQITSIGCAIVKTNIPYAIGVIMASTVSVLLYFFLIPLLGKEGAALSTLAGGLVLSGYVTYRAQLLYFIPYDVRKNLLLILFGGSLVIISIFLPKSDFAMQIFYKSVLMASFLFFVFYTNQQAIKRLIGNRILKTANKD